MSEFRGGSPASAEANVIRVKNKMDLVAERNLVLDCGDKQLNVSVKIGLPLPSGDDWICPYEVWIQDTCCKSFQMHGVDSMQALQLDVELEVKARKLGGKLQWLDEPVVNSWVYQL